MAARAGWAHRQHVMRRSTERLVFVDGEPSRAVGPSVMANAVRTDLTRLYGSAPIGRCLTGSALFGRWQTQTLIAGLTTEGLIAPWVIAGAKDRDAFDTSVETLLLPAITIGTVVILDTLSAHRSPRAAQVLKAYCTRLPPPDSPQLKPVELAFAKRKAHLRRIGARTFDSLITAIGTVCNLVTPDECLNDIAHAGFVADQMQKALKPKIRGGQAADQHIL
jgi:transposase